MIKSQCTGQTEDKRVENNISELEKRAKEMIRMWLKVIKRIKNRIEKLRDGECDAAVHNTSNRMSRWYSRENRGATILKRNS